MEMDVPFAKSGSGKDQNEITINIKTTGEIYFEKNKIEWAEFEKRSSSGVFKNKSVLLNIERKVPFEIFIKAADLLKTGNVKMLNLGLKD